jgi:hypothetical protein
MAGKARKKKGNPHKSWDIHVNSDQWPGFTDKELQDLFSNHIRGEKSKKKAGRGKGKKSPEAHIYIGMGKNPMSFSITICPTYPCGR